VCNDLVVISKSASWARVLFGVILGWERRRRRLCHLKVIPLFFHKFSNKVSFKFFFHCNSKLAKVVVVVVVISP
jgi:hypothetical protein